MVINNKKLRNLIDQVNKTLDIFETTKDRRPFIALEDQLEQFIQDEIDNNKDSNKENLNNDNFKKHS